MINIREKQTAPFIGNRWVPDCKKRFRRLEGENSRTLIGFSFFTKEATKRGVSVARIPEMSDGTSVLFQDTLVTPLLHTMRPETNSNDFGGFWN